MQDAASDFIFPAEFHSPRKQVEKVAASATSGDAED
jgi:hypothetical protein